ncbi:hypothetical protein SELMODRAFT_129900 [Selaginella moellendorffii]|uniref:Pentacotripeptide-repeat region of PRORP domain-containing protein n=1 Tax=Selaginella moellendorffii TaxID=88036 RepID=D8T1V1_SELML|nr:hypothetical protein SELMODRAFT_129900 [Selaginella moellendorffii]
MPCPNAVSWNGVIQAFAQNGNLREALEILREMCAEGLAPDGVSFIGALAACSYIGLVQGAKRCLCSMIVDFGVIPGVEHYHCVLDALGRAGKLGDAEELLRGMPHSPNDATWTSLLGSSKIHCDPARAAEAARKLDPTNAAPYLMLAR